MATCLLYFPHSTSGMYSSPRHLRWCDGLDSDHTVPSTVPGVSVGPDCFTELDHVDDVTHLDELLDLLMPVVTHFAVEAAKLVL